MKHRARCVPAVCAAAVVFLGCHYNNPHGDQGLPPVTRLITEPSGATLYVERLNLVLETPCDLPHTIYGTDVVSISKDGYLPYRGPLRDLPQVARATYKCELRR